MKEATVKFSDTLDELPFGSKVCIYGAGLEGSNFKELIETSRKEN